MHWSYPRELAVMAAVSTTLFYLPVAALTACLALLFGFSPTALLTFGGRMHAALGLCAWWAIGFVPALIYSVCMLPPNPKDAL